MGAPTQSAVNDQYKNLCELYQERIRILESNSDDKLKILLKQIDNIEEIMENIQEDIETEEEEEIKEYLWHHFKGDLLRRSVAGFPQWYKDRLSSEVVKCII